jgi:hypothetical protein
MLTDVRNSLRWGNQVTIPASAKSNRTDIFDIFDTGIQPLFTNPAVVTLTVDLESQDGVSPLPNSQVQYWLEIECGLGATRRKFRADCRSGQQISFAANSIRAKLVRQMIAGGGTVPSIIARSAVAVGARSTNQVVTYTTPWTLFTAGVYTGVIVPKHAKSCRFILDDVNIPATIKYRQLGVNLGQPPEWILTAAEVRDSMIGKFDLPALASQLAIWPAADVYSQISFNLDI